MDELLRELNEINAVANLRADYAKTLALVRALKSGDVKLDEVMLTADGWQVAAAEPQAREADAEQAEPGA